MDDTSLSGRQQVRGLQQVSMKEASHFAVMSLACRSTGAATMRARTYRRPSNATAA
jgi:hypothetical protein